MRQKTVKLIGLFLMLIIIIINTQTFKTLLGMIQKSCSLILSQSVQEKGVPEMKNLTYVLMFSIIVTCWMSIKQIYPHIAGIMWRWARQRGESASRRVMSKD